MKRVEEESHDNAERWLLTYSDLITLLMVFFVIMYAMSSINSKKYSQLAGSLNSAMGGGNYAMGGGGNLIGDGNGISNTPGVQVVPGTQKELETVKNSIDEYVEDSGLSKNIETRVEERGVVITLKNSIIFDSGSASIKDESKKEIINLGKLLKQMGKYIRIEGHTDNIPISNPLFKSNLQLSAIRATNVAEVLVRESGINPELIVAIGYGEYRPIADNSTSSGRAQNRRVDIVVVSSEHETVDKKN